MTALTRPQPCAYACLPQEVGTRSSFECSRSMFDPSFVGAVQILVILANVAVALINRRRGDFAGAQLERIAKQLDEIIALLKWRIERRPDTAAGQV